MNKETEKARNLLTDIKGKDVHIVGISGMEGWAAADFLSSKGAKIFGHDFAGQRQFKDNFFSLRDYLSSKEREEEWQKFNRLRIPLKLAPDYLEGIEKADLVFVPQSWFRYPFNDKIDRLKKKLNLIRILDLYFNFCPAKIIAITGSSGKSTTSRLAYLVLKTQRRTLLSGNDREAVPVLREAEQLTKDDYLVLEVSNRQLIDFHYSPDIAAIINIFPTHLDDHSDLAGYKRVKQNLIRNQGEGQYSIFNLDDSQVLALKLPTKAKKIYLSLKQKVENGGYKQGGWGYFSSEKEPVFSFDKLKIPGEHNQLNALTAAVIGKICQVNNRNIRKALYRFKGLKHRLEYLAKIDGRQFYEDSQSTNPLSTLAAINSFKKGQIILILGGKKKPNSADFDILADKSLADKNLKKSY